MPSADLLHDRNMSTSTTCGLYGAKDSWQHSLPHCSATRCVWALQDHDLVEALNNSNEPDSKIWIFALMDMLSPQQFTQVVVTLWSIWYARRQALYENIFQSPLPTHNFIMKYLRELNEYQPKQEVRIAAVRQPLCRMRWIPPTPGVAKLRIDGAVSRDQGEGTFSAICRNSGGMFLGASVIKRRGISDLATLEALACREAPAIASSANTCCYCFWLPRCSL